MTEQMDGQVSLFGHDTWFGKTSPERSAATAGETSAPSSKKRSGSQSRKPPLCLYLKRDGRQADASWATDGALLGGYSTHSFGESPNAAVESHLSQILEVSPHPKYYLSARACLGILNRASRRGKDLPEALKTALLMQSEFGGGCDGGGKGALVQEEKSGTLGCNNDQTLFCAGFKLGNSEKARSIGYCEEQAPTMNAECGGNKPAVLCPGHNLTILDMSHACDVVRDCGETVPCLQARMGTGGNQIPLTFRQRKFGDYCRDDVAGTCKARDRGGGTGNIVQNAMTVRRLTPMECERLQGFPDGWTDIGDWTDSKGKKRQTTDAARYKALGNSIALPPWKWVLKRLCAQYERDATMASLFDGIGGFPLVWETLNGKGSCLWASEIEEFPVAVTRKRFGGQNGL